MYAQIVVSGLANGLVYVLMGLGLVLLYKGTKVLNFAHGEIGLLSVYVSYTLVVGQGLPVWVGAMAAVAAGGVLALLMERTIVRALGPGNMLPKAIATLGVFLILSIVMHWFWRPDPTRMPGLFPSGTTRFAGAVVSWSNVGVLAFSIVVLGLLMLFFTRHPLGLVMRASADNETGAALIGIRPGLVTATLWTLTGMLAALCGVLFVPMAFLAAGVMTPVLLKGMAAAVIGGFDSLPGVLIGGLLIGVAENLLAFWISPAWETPLAFVVLFAILVVAPRGIVAERRVLRV